MKELEKAQNFLRENVIRSFWKKLTTQHPSTCVHEGISIHFDQPLTKEALFEMVDKMTQCSHKKLAVAAPLYQYNFEPDNSTPHHISALTLNRHGDNYILTLFNPKGKGSLRKKQEKIFLDLLKKLLQIKLQSKVIVRQYSGPNLQINDNVGLCQLYSLLYLYEYVNHPQDITPDKFIKHIRKKHGHYNQKTLLNFWCTVLKKDVDQVKLHHTSFTRNL